MQTGSLAAMALAFTLAPADCAPLRATVNADTGQRAAFWLESSLHRVYLQSPPGSKREYSITAPRNGQVSLQACVRNESSEWLGVTCEVGGAAGLAVQVRRVDYVPVRFHTGGTDASELEGVGMVPGYVPDILHPSQNADVGSYTTQPFWITLRVSREASPGERRLVVRFLRAGKTIAELPVNVRVAPFTVEQRRNFPVTHWWRSECLWDYYKTGMYEDEKHWDITRNYIENLIAHGTDTIFVPVLFMRRVTFQRPAQLLKVTRTAPDRYEFDFSNVRRFVKLARECGAKYYEFPHVWIYWGVKHPMPVYTWKDGKATLLWAPESDGHGEEYYSFLRQYLSALHTFLTGEGILGNSFFHLSDEPGAADIENYRKARTFLRETAPWMKVMDALSDISYGRQRVTDMPIPMVSAAQPFIEEKIPHWVYYCCIPGGPWINRFLDTPLTKIRMSGWLFYRLGAKGFLHWGYNYWHYGEEEKLADIFGAPGLAPGDNFVVYPGPDGKPMDSIRWEVFAESLQDYAMLQTAGIEPEAPLLKDIKSYADFPKTENWITERVERVLEQGQ